MSEKKLFLLYDSGCASCVYIAQQAMEMAQGRLELRSMRDEDTQHLLNENRPGWAWEPMVMEIVAGRHHIYSGLAMRAKLVLALGIKNAWQIARMVSKAQGPVVGVNFERREFLRKAGVMMAGITVLPLISSAGRDLATKNEEQRAECNCKSWSTGCEPGRRTICREYCVLPNGSYQCRSGYEYCVTSSC